jgi:hypothetical protein
MTASFIIGPNQDPFTSTEVVFCVGKSNDDQLNISTDRQTFFMKAHNGYINEKQKVYFQLEIDKDSPFWNKFKDYMLRMLDEAQ